jgi:hypothetical protein
VKRLLHDIADVGEQIDQYKRFEKRMTEIATRELLAGREESAQKIAEDLDLALATTARKFLEECIATELGRLAERSGL